MVSEKSLRGKAAWALCCMHTGMSLVGHHAFPAQVAGTGMRNEPGCTDNLWLAAGARHHHARSHQDGVTHGYGGAALPLLYKSSVREP